MSTATAFVICANEAAAAQIVEELKSLQFSFGGVQPREAPSRKNIIWENLDSNRRSNSIRGCILTTVFFFIIFFLCSGSTFASYVSLLLPGFIANLLGGLLPAVLVPVYQFVIIPMVIRLIVKLERNHTQGEDANSSMVKFLFLLSMNIFLMPTIVGSILNTVIDGESFGIGLAL
jgi:UPF0716 family protein affecting phage T7 exclusion